MDVAVTGTFSQVNKHDRFPQPFSTAVCPTTAKIEERSSKTAVIYCPIRRMCERQHCPPGALMKTWQTFSLCSPFGKAKTLMTRKKEMTRISPTHRLLSGFPSSLKTKADFRPARTEVLTQHTHSPPAGQWWHEPTIIYSTICFSKLFVNCKTHCTAFCINAVLFYLRFLRNVFHINNTNLILIHCNTSRHFGLFKGLRVLKQGHTGSANMFVKRCVCGGEPIWRLMPTADTVFIIRLNPKSHLCEFG